MQTVTGLVSYLLLVVVAIAGPATLRAVGRLVGRSLVRLRPSRPPHEAPVRAVGRPIEAIACDARRLGSRFRWMPPGTSFTRFEAGRRAYDAVLAEACQALAIDHLLGVLPPGVELDQERTRVETALERAGLELLRIP